MLTDVHPEVGAYETGQMSNVHGRDDEVAGGYAEVESLRSDENITIQLLRIGRRNSSVPDLRPKPRRSAQRCIGEGKVASWHAAKCIEALDAACIARPMQLSRDLVVSHGWSDDLMAPALAINHPLATGIRIGHACPLGDRTERRGVKNDS